MIPTFDFAKQQSWESEPKPEVLAKMQSVFRESGCLHLKGIYPPTFLETLHRHFSKQYRKYMNPHQGHDNALKVGNKRWMVTVKMQDAFAETLLYAHPLLLSFAKLLLGEECVLNSFGCVVALPGALDQHGHRDLPALFDDTPIDGELPCFALTLLLPLVDCNEVQGTTELRVGSHLVTEAEAEQMAAARPDISLGSCVLMDYRLHHGGTANLSDKPRPLLYMAYSRPWFLDYRNYKRQSPLWITRKTYRQMEREHRALFSRAKVTWW